MRKLSFFAIVLSVLWGGYWFGGSNLLEKGATDFLASDFGADDPVQISHSGLVVQGFPGRFDLQLSGINLTDTKNRLLWSAPSVQIFAPSYKPYEITVAMPSSHILQVHGQDLRFNSAEMVARLGFAPLGFFSGSAIIENIDLRLKNLAVKSSFDWETTVDKASLNLRKNQSDPKLYDLEILANSITLPDHLHKQIDPAGQQPDSFDYVLINSRLGFSNPWDLAAEHSKQPELTEIQLENLNIVWGALQFSTEGTLKIDHNGYPNGTLNLTAKGWQKMFQLAKDANLVDPEFSQTIHNGLKTMAQMSDGEDIIKAPLNFADGQMSLGVFPIGPAPRFK